MYARYAELPPDLVGMDFKSFKSRPDIDLSDVVRAAQELAGGKAPFRWLVLAGSNGWGKTHLGVSVLNARIANPSWGPPGKYANYPLLLNDLRQGFDDNTYQWRLDMYIAAPLLLLDDLGAASQKRGAGDLSWAEEQMYLILNSRALSRLETIITTNVDAESLDSRIADRLLNTGTGLVKAFHKDAASYRSGRRWR